MTEDNVFPPAQTSAQPTFSGVEVVPQTFSPKTKLAPLLIVFWTVLVLISGIGVGYFFLPQQITSENNPEVMGNETEKERPLLKYSFPELAQRQAQPSPIKLQRVLKKAPEFTSYVFTYESEGKKISGLINIPHSSDPNQTFPVILMLRGFVPQETYSIGMGTIRPGEAFAKQGYITVAPDFLGFGESDPQPGDSIEARVIKPLHVLDLIASVEAFHMQPIIFNREVAGRFDAKRMGIWGHSNGGQIALSILEITGRPFPTVLWAPVTKPFPYSVLYFTDEAEDFGRSLRAILANFEQDYDIEQFTIGKYSDKITAHIQLHQGTKDDAVPVTWSDTFVRNMDRIGKKDLVEYFVYEGADHSLLPNWNEAVVRSIEFFQKGVKDQQFIAPSPSPTPIPTTVSTSVVQTATPSATSVEQTATRSGFSSIQ